MKICAIIAIIFGGLWAAALVLLAIGTFGWFGQERDPLSGVFLVPLGMPWNLLFEVPEGARLLWGVLAPGVNLSILVLLCRFLPRRR